MKYIKQLASLVALIAIGFCLLAVGSVNAQEESGSIGVEGRIGAEPPSVAATISVPSNGQTFTSIPITVSGLCPGDVLVKVFKNNVFAGSTDCENGSYSMSIDLFSGQNDLVARVYDSLDQPGPDSNVVTVTFNDTRPGITSRPTLTSNYAKRGANPGETLTWPIILSGGDGPYAVSVDWGDGKPADLFTQDFAGTFDIKHTYDNPGAFNVIVRASDRNGSVAFLQLVAIANGALSQTETSEPTDDREVVVRYVWWPLLFVIPLLIVAFWLGRRNAMDEFRKRIERGARPF